MKPLVRLYTPTESNRLRYVCDLIFNDLLGIEYRISSDTTENFHINYSDDTTVSGLQCLPKGLLFQKGINPSIKNDLRFEKWKDSVWFFKTAEAGIPFDFLSATFFLISRYEEYLDFYADDHDRFTARESVLAQN